MDIRHLTAALTRAGLRVAVEQNDDRTARISARDIPAVLQWVRQNSTTINARTIVYLVERPLNQNDVAVLAREIESAQRAIDRDRSIRQGRIPSGMLSGREVSLLAQRGFLGNGRGFTGR